MSIPNLLFGDKLWIFTRNDDRQIQSLAMKFLKIVKGCSINKEKIRNDYIRRELEVMSILIYVQYIDNIKYNRKLQREMDGLLGMN